MNALECGGVTAYPELTRVPVLGERIHAQRPREVVLGLRLEVLELLCARIAFGIKIFERVEGA